MRQISGSWVYAIVLICIPRICTAATVSAWVEPVEQTRPLGDLIYVTLRADLPDPVLGWGVDITYDHSVLTMMGTPTISPPWSAGFAPDGDGLAGLAFPSGIQGNRVMLATLVFSATAAGETDLAISLTPGDPNEGFALDPAGFASVSFGAAHVQVVPEPATIFLLCGMAFAMCWRPREENLLQISTPALICSSSLPV